MTTTKTRSSATAFHTRRVTIDHREPEAANPAGHHSGLSASTSAALPAAGSYRKSAMARMTVPAVIGSTNDKGGEAPRPVARSASVTHAPANANAMPQNTRAYSK